MRGYIYLIQNSINGKGYIGKTERSISERFRKHKGSANNGSRFALHCAMRKYGIENFSVVEIVSCEERYLLNDLEKHYIKFFRTFSSEGHGYNLTRGGDGASGLVFSSQSLAKMSISHKGKKLSEQCRANMSKAARGGIRSKEWKEKITKALTGRRHSRESIVKMANAKRGRKLSEEHKAKIKASVLRGLL